MIQKGVKLTTSKKVWEFSIFGIAYKSGVIRVLPIVRLNFYNRGVTKLILGFEFIKWEISFGVMTCEKDKWDILDPCMKTGTK